MSQSAAVKSASEISLTVLTPKKYVKFINLMRRTGVATFIWGPPGIGKSSIAKQIATSLGIAYIDFRLAQVNPEDVRGIPNIFTYGGVECLKWIAPAVMPRDIKFNHVASIDDPEPVVIKFYNPCGDNGIPYCVDPEIAFRIFTPDADVKVLRQPGEDGLGYDEVEVALFRVENGGVTDKMVPGKFRVFIEGMTKAIVGLDEFNLAPQSIQATAYQWILDRRIGEYIVPEGVYLMAMGNRENDRGVTFRIAPPVANRFVHAELKFDYDEWEEHALESMYHPLVVSYLNTFRDHAFRYQPDKLPPNPRGIETPRSWEFVSRVLWEFDREPTDEDVLRAAVCGAVGDGTGGAFLTYRESTEALPNIESVLSGSMTSFPGLSMQLSFALTMSLCYRLKEEADNIKLIKDWRNSNERKTWLKRADNYFRFINANFKPEISIMGVKMAISTHELPFDIVKMPVFREFARVFKPFIMDRD